MGTWPWAWADLVSNSSPGSSVFLVYVFHLSGEDSGFEFSFVQECLIRLNMESAFPVPSNSHLEKIHKLDDLQLQARD